MVVAAIAWYLRVRSVRFGDDSPGPPRPRNARELGAALFRRTTEHAAVEKEVMAAVRSRGGDLPRDERRTLLEGELERHGITRDPMWIEQRLDDLERSGPQRAARKGEALLALGALVSSPPGGGEQAAATPAWMQPPADAQVDVCSPLLGATRASHSSAVVLDTDVDSLLGRVLEEAPVGTRRVAVGVVVWFDADGDGADDSEVTVHIGSHRVGTVSPQASLPARRSVQAAAQQGQRPRGHGQLSSAEHLIPPYLLLVTLPADGT
jgi:hypothetical protein